jgi:hypothetical protein
MDLLRLQKMLLICCELLVVDEASMVDIQLAHRLLMRSRRAAGSCS